MIWWKMLNPWLLYMPKFLRMDFLFSTPSCGGNFTVYFLWLKRHSKVYVKSKVVFYGSCFSGKFLHGPFSELTISHNEFWPKISQKYLLYFLFTYPSLMHCWIKQIFLTSLSFGFHSCKVEYFSCIRFFGVTLTRCNWYPNIEIRNQTLCKNCVKYVCLCKIVWRLLVLSS